MKKILCSILSAGLLSTALAQQPVDRSKQPKPGPAPVIAIKDAVTYNLPNGMTVLVVENHKLPKISVRLNIDQGPILEGKKAGVTDIMGDMLMEGTTNKPKDQFDEEVDRIGADLNLSASGGNVSALTRYFEQALALMADAIQHPALPQESFDKIKKQKITGIKSQEKNAGAISRRVLNALAFGKTTALGEFETEETYNNLTLDDIKTAYKDYVTPSRSYLTFVGDIKPEAAKALAVKYFGKWTGKKLTLMDIRKPDNPAATEIDFVDLPTAVQGEINVVTVLSNPMNNPDYHALLLANQILGGGADSKLFMNLREKHGFTYGSYSSVGRGRFPALFTANAQVRSEKADSAVAEIMAEMENMRKGNITDEELQTAKALYNGSFALGMEDPGTTANYASNILINGLPKDFYRVFLQKVNAVTKADIERVSKKYFLTGNSRIVLVGNGSKILPNLTRLGYPIKKFDKFANPIVDKPADVNVKETPKNTESISAFKLIDDYLKAIGGKDELKKVNTLKVAMNVEMMGRTFEATELRMNPGKHYLDMKMGAMKMFVSAFDGTKGYQMQMGQKKDMDEKEIKEGQDDKAVIPQLYYLTPEFKLDYIGTAKVGTEEAYKLKVTKPSGKVQIEYYSTKTGLLLRDESTSVEDGQETNVVTDYNDYRKVGNIQYPHAFSQQIGEMEMKFSVKEVKINEGVTDADFQ
jgi:predicted Zn-dependent peptidase